MGICMGKALVGFEMLTGMFSPSSGGELVPRRRWCSAGPSRLISSIDPQPRGFGLILSFALALLEQLDRGIIYYLTGDCVAICRQGMRMACASNTRSWITSETRSGSLVHLPTQPAIIDPFRSIPSLANIWLWRYRGR